MRIARIAAALALTAALAAGSTPALAAGDGSIAWSVTPVITNVGAERANFQLAADPGQTLSDAALVRNSGSDALVLEVSGADAVTDAAGQLDIATEEAGSADAGTWIRPGVDAIEVAPGELARIPFTVEVPDDAVPGEHAAALLTVLPRDGETVAVDMRYATRVTVTVSGELTAGLALADGSLDVATGFWPWEAATAAASYSASNTGNTRLTAPQLLEAQGRQLFSSPDGSSGLADLAELLPGASVDVDARLDGLAAWSPFFSATVSVAPQVLTTATGDVPTIAQQQVDLEAVAIAPGWWVILAAVLVVAAVVIALIVRRRRRSAR
ncbi:WxL protein peptidoglycan domain-containing protein [Microbacterium indicum]|uniref:WxL protein peptidoglycan domain-containing protein n=1 Tax=Microbacterium indicum TaxID=358100 RepID=UPI000401A9D7|nr:DUF916 domain-containing protein [Microbacterium indicum]